MHHPPLYTRRQVARIGAGLSLLAATSPAALAQADGPRERLAALADDYQDRLFRLFPLDATENAGDAKYEALLEIDIAPAHRIRQRAVYEGLLARLRGVDPARLEPEDRTTWQLLEADAKQRLALLAWPMHLLPVSQNDCLPVRLGQWAGGLGSQPLKTAANYEHFLARLAKLPAWVDQAIANMEHGLAGGITQPKPLIERLLPQLDALLPADPARSPYLAGVRAFPDTVPAASRPRIAARYERLVATRVRPAVQKLCDFLAGRYLPGARTSSGLGALPQGAAWYRHLVRHYTTTDTTPAEVHALGLREVDRIRGEMERVKAAFGFEGPLNDFLRSLDQRQELAPFRSEAEVLAAYVAINEKVKAGLPKLFERAPRAAIEIRAVEPARRETASDYYVPPALDGSRPGVFFAVVSDPAQYRTTRMVSLFLHEGQPGHHDQMALAQELPVPKFRQALWYDAFGEGWALYAEGLGHDLGVYGSPDAQLGRLLMELHRALRLVIDTGLHDLGWSREQTIAYLQEKEGSTESSARRATERYMAWPGQALAYKTGELKILQLRERAKRKLGPKFDLRVFHTQVLQGGCMPLAMLEARIDAWLAA